MTGQEKGFKQPLACWVTRHKDLKQSVDLFFLGCPFSKAPLCASLQQPSIEPRSHGGAVKEILPWQPYSSLKNRNPYARYSV